MRLIQELISIYVIYRAALDHAARHDLHGLLARGPVDLPADWHRRVHEPVSKEEDLAFKTYILRGRPMGDVQWVLETAQRLGLEHALRPSGRPLGWRKPTPKTGD